MGAGVTLQTTQQTVWRGPGRRERSLQCVSRARELAPCSARRYLCSCRMGMAEVGWAGGPGVSVRGAQGREMTLLGLRASTIYQSV